MTDLNTAARQALEAMRDLITTAEIDDGTSGALAGAHAAITALSAALEAQPAEPVAVLPGYALVRTPITEGMHAAACKVLTRANGLDGTPQRMLDAMLAAAPSPAPRQALADERAGVEARMRSAGMASLLAEVRSSNAARDMDDDLLDRIDMAIADQERAHGIGQGGAHA